MKRSYIHGAIKLFFLIFFLHCRCKVMESLMKWFPNLHKNSGLIRGKEVCVESEVSVK